MLGANRAESSFCRWAPGEARSLVTSLVLFTSVLGALRGPFGLEAVILGEI